MESETGSDDRAARDAEEALRQIGADRARLAARMASPWWYGAAGGALTAALLLSALLDDGWWRFLPALLGIAVGIAIDQAYRRVTGVAPRTLAGWRNTGVHLGLFAAVFLLYCAAALFAGLHLPWAVIGVAVLGFVSAWAAVHFVGRAFVGDFADAR